MCDERERLIGYVYGECDAEERQRVGGHLAGCPVCQEEIGGLEQVRQDLLAWDVPAHQSVWTPFAPARPAAWWSEVPAWAMAAAATLTFAIGAAGGMVTTAVMFAEPATSQAAADVPAPAAVIPAGYSQADLTALEKRLLQRLRADLVAALPAVPATSVNAVTHTDLVAFETRMGQQMLGYLGVFTEDLGNANERVTSMQEEVEVLRNKAFRGLGPGHN
jgi:anti-sigma factor RsiW